MSSVVSGFKKMGPTCVAYPVLPPPLPALRRHPRVNEALSLSAMEREEMLSRQWNLVMIQQEIQQQELQALKDEVIRLSRSVD